MKRFFVTLIILISIKNQALVGNCPTFVIKDPQALSMIEFLQSFEGRFSLGSCEVEIQVCNLEQNNDETRKNLLADLLIVDKKGFERYIPFYFSEFKNYKSKYLIKSNSRMLHYEFIDKNFDPFTGKDERWAVEFVKTSDLKNLKYLEVGYSSQVERTNKTSKKWIICGAERKSQKNSYANQNDFMSFMSGYNFFNTYNEGESNE